MSTYQIVAIALVVMAIGWVLFLRDYFSKKLTKDKLEIIDYACEKGVGYAEKIFKKDPTIDRNKLAIDFAFEVIQKAKIIPDNFLFIIKGIVEDKVRQLPKTHDANGNVIQ